MTVASQPNGNIVEKSAEPASKTPPPPPVKAWTAPKSWTGLFSQPVAPKSSSEASKVSNYTEAGNNNGETLGEALRIFNADAKDAKVAFLEPRGLVNSGNMCYMNSVSNDGS